MVGTACRETLCKALRALFADERYINALFNFNLISNKDKQKLSSVPREDHYVFFFFYNHSLVHQISMNVVSCVLIRYIENVLA